MRIETTVVIPHFQSVETLIAVLIQLQSQTLPPSEIYIIDCSTDKSGLRIANKFAYNNIPITVEVKKGTIYENWNTGIELSQMTHPDASILIINDDVLLPIDFIEHMIEAQELYPGLVYTPSTPPREHYENNITTVFSPYSEMVVESQPTRWMSGFVFLLTPKCIEEVGLFDTQFQLWYGDTDYEKRVLDKGHITCITSTYVYHFGGKSYDYQLEAHKQTINKDRALFIAKHEKI